VRTQQIDAHAAVAQGGTREGGQRLGADQRRDPERGADRWGERGVDQAGGVVDVGAPAIAHRAGRPIARATRRRRASGCRGWPRGLAERSRRGARV